MVGINNSLAYTEYPVLDSYLGNLFECRTNSQTALLPIIDYLVGTKEQTQKGDVSLPHCILGSERSYLDYLQRKYHKRPLSFSVSNIRNQDSAILDAITKLIRKTRKYSDDAVLGLSDLFENRPELEDYILMTPFKKTITEVAEQYHHTTPQSLLLQPSVSEENTKGLLKKALPYSLQTLDQQPSDIENIYTTMYASIKTYAIDFEVLKLYDFLCETDEQQYKSNNLVEIEPSLIAIGQRDYAKLPFTTAIVPSSDKDEQQTDHIIIDEWASTIRKALELRESIASDYHQLYSTHP